MLKIDAQIERVKTETKRAVNEGGCGTVWKPCHNVETSRHATSKCRDGPSKDGGDCLRIPYTDRS